MSGRNRDWMDFLGVVLGGAALMGAIMAIGSGKSFFRFFGLSLYAMIVGIVSVAGTMLVFVVIGTKRNPDSGVGWAIAGFLVGMLFTAPLMNTIITKVIGF